MGLSKKLLIGLGVGLSATVVAIGTGVGISLSQQKTNLADLAKKITKDAIVIKSLENETEAKQEILATSDLYAFNVKTQQLSLKNGVLSDGVKATLSVNSINNTATFLNSGKLKVSINLTEEKHKDNTYSFEVEVDNFKAVNEDEFKDIFDSSTEDKFILNITPSWKNEASVVAIADGNATDTFAPDSYATLSYLNDESVPLNANKLINDAIGKAIASIGAQEDWLSQFGLNAEAVLKSLNASETDQETDVKNGTGLTAWLYGDARKEAESKKLSIQEKVKVARLSGDDRNTYFHLVSKDENSRIKLVIGEGQTLKEAAISEIKTTNLLASDVTISPKDIDHSKTSENLNALKALKENDKYLEDKTDSSLNRDLSINLSSSTEENKDPNKVFIKPSVANWNKEDKANELPFSVTVSFGEKDYATSFSTNNEEELEQLKAAGFKFNLFTKKIEGDDNPVGSSKLTTEEIKTELEKFFKQDNYNKPITASVQNTSNKFTKTSFDLNTVNSNLKFSINADSSNSQNWLAFANYSYKGITDSNAFLTPSLSLIRIEISSDIS